MISFTLPRLNPDIYKSIDTSEINRIIIDDTHQYYLENIKKNIKNVQKEWDIYKKITNTYELLYSHIPFERFCVSNLENIPRTFFIATEILHKFYEPLIEQENSITTFHFSDKYNGMVNAFINIRKNYQNDVNTSFKKYNDLDRDVKSLRFEELKNNILDINNFKIITDKYKSSIDYITADIEEIENSNKMIIAQICYSLCIQKQDGNFILKFVDTFTNKSIDMIALLSSMYKEVSITKPLACENYSSETYLICKNFIPTNNSEFYPYILNYFTNILNNDKLDNQTFLNNASCVNDFFANKIKEYSTIFTQYQIEHIHNTLNIIATDKNKNLCIHTSFKQNNETIGDTEFNFNREDFEKSKAQYLTNLNIKKCLQYCSSHHIGVNKVLLDSSD